MPEAGVPDERTVEHAPVPPWRRPAAPKRPARRDRLDRDRIVDVALTVLDAEGLDAVTMRRVARELDTGAASLYAHVADKDELYELMIDRVTADIRIPDPEPARWREQLVECAVAAQRVWTAHRDLARAALGRVALGPQQTLLSERMLGILRAGGVPDQAAAWALDRLALMIVADACEASVYQARIAAGDDLDAYFGQIHDYLRDLPAETYPNLTATAEQMVAGDGDQRFRFAVDLFVRGLASYRDE